MDAAIIWAVVWGVLALTTSGLAGYVVGGIVYAIGYELVIDWVSVLGVLLGFTIGIFWFIWCIVHMTESIITAANLLG